MEGKTPDLTSSITKMSHFSYYLMRTQKRELTYLCCRSIRRRCSIKKGVLKNFAKFTEKHLYQNLFFNGVACLRPAILLKKKLWHRRFPVNFTRSLRTPFSQNTSRRLLMMLCISLLLTFCLLYAFKNCQCFVNFY